MLIHFKYYNDFGRNQILRKIITKLSELLTIEHWYFCDIGYELNENCHFWILELYLEEKHLALINYSKINKWLGYIKKVSLFSINKNLEPSLLNVKLFTENKIPNYFLPILSYGSRQSLKYLASNNTITKYINVQVEVKYLYESIFRIKSKRIKAINFYLHWLKYFINESDKLILENDQFRDLIYSQNEHVFKKKKTINDLSLYNIIRRTYFDKKYNYYYNETSIFQDIARLSHIQTLRILGPFGNNNIGIEIICIQNLLEKIQSYDPKSIG